MTGLRWALTVTRSVSFARKKCAEANFFHWVASHSIPIRAGRDRCMPRWHRSVQLAAEEVDVAVRRARADNDGVTASS